MTKSASWPSYVIYFMLHMRVHVQNLANLQTWSFGCLVSGQLFGVLLLGSLSLLFIWSLFFLVQLLPHLPDSLGNVSDLVVWVGRLYFCSFFTHKDEVGRQGALGRIGILLAHRGAWNRYLLRSVIKLESL